MLTETPAAAAAPAALPTGTVTFLFTDIEGSTQRWEQFPIVMKAALDRHDALLRGAIDGEGGVVFQTAGDSMVAAFPAPAPALSAALTAQRALLAESWPAELGAIRVRMALHTGPAELRDGQYHAEYTLNRLARLLAAGHGGQILVTATTQALLESSAVGGPSRPDGRGEDAAPTAGEQGSGIGDQDAREPAVGGPFRPGGRSEDATPTGFSLVPTQNSKLKTENSVEWQDLGERWLKDLVRPLHIYQVLAPDLPHEFPPLKTLDAPALPGALVAETSAEVENPYKGLRAFAEADAGDFFGREALTERLVARLGEGVPLARFLAVVGPSGSGKSSVVRAGVLPALRRGGLPGSEGWRIVELIPGTEPLRELAATLAAVSGAVAEDLLAQLQADEYGLLRVARQLVGGEQGTGDGDGKPSPTAGGEGRVRGEPRPPQLLLVVDQFEEVFTLVAEEPARVHFLESLHRAVTTADSVVRVIVTLRADFYDRPLLYPDPGELVRQRTEVVLPLSPEELARAIGSPAARVGVQVEPALVGAMIQDVAEQPGTLPLLEFALTELFERREHNRLTLAAYRATGGVQGALARRADATYAVLSAAEQEVARQVFLRLVTLGEGTEDTRRRVRRAELAGLAVDPDILDGVLEQFSRYRLLTFDREPGSHEPTVEVAHEALIRSWGRLREWLDASRAALAVQRQLGEATTEWTRAGQDASYLASGVRLAQFEALAAGGDLALTADEQAYVATSVTERERQAVAEKDRQARELELARQSAEAAERAAAESQRAAAAQRSAANRLRGLLVGAAIFLVVAVGLALVAFDQRQSAQANAVVANSQRATAVANGAEADLQRQLAQSSAATAVADANRSNALRLASEAAAVVDSHGDPQLAALLAIRSLRQEYSAGGDADLIRAAGLEFPARVFAGHTARITEVAMTRDGRTLLTTSADKTARLWDVQSGREIQRFTGHQDVVLDGAISPDGSFVATSSADSTVRTWDSRTGAELREMYVQGASDVALSPDGRYVLAGSSSGVAWMYDTGTGHLVRHFSGHTGPVFGVAFSPDGKQVLTGGDDHTARLWDAATGQAIRVFQGHTNSVYRGAFSPDGRTVVTSSSDKTARLWDTQTGQELQRFTDASSEIYSVAFAPDGKTVLTGGWNSNARLWDVATGKEVRALPSNTDITSVAFSPDGRYLLTGSLDATARVWPTQSVARIWTFSADISGGVFSPDGKYVLIGSADKTARLWNAASGFELERFSGHTDYVITVAFSPDGKQALTGSVDQTARLWDVSSGAELQRFVGHTQLVNAVAFSPDGKQVLTGSNDGTARLWDAASGVELRRFAGHSDSVGSVAFSPNGKYVLTGSADKTARLWDTATGQELRRFVGHAAGVESVTFSPDGKQALTGSDDRTARIWDVSTGAELRRFSGHGDAVTSAVFSPDGRLVLTASLDRTARLWDVATGAEVRRLIGHTELLNSAVFSPDGKLVLTTGRDKTARLWDTDYHATIAALCSQLLRDFTADERAQYEITDAQSTCPGQ